MEGTRPTSVEGRREESEQDAEGWAALYAEDVCYEDPVGIRQVQGRAEVAGRIWDDIVRNRVRIWLTDEVIVCGSEALAIMACEMPPAISLASTTGRRSAARRINVLSLTRDVNAQSIPSVAIVSR